MEHLSTFTLAVVATLLLIMAPTEILGSPSGAPTAACADMTPQHGFAPQSSSAPFRTELPMVSVTNDNVVRLELRSHNDITTFKGFLVMAFRKNDADAKPIGTFKLPSSGKLIDCLGGVQNAATHSDRSEKKLVTVDWMPPQDFSGEVIFRTTYVQQRDTFWVKTESTALTVAAPTTPATSTTPMSTTTTANVPTSTTTASTTTAGTTTATTSKPSSASQFSSTWAGLMGLVVLAFLVR